MRRIWNRPDLPVWSLVTQGVEGDHNMNICTYVTSISMDPKLMLVAVYNDTQTYKNIIANSTKPVLLQLLTQTLAPAVRVCGQQSGAKIDKMSRLKKRYSLSDYRGLPYFSEAAGVMVLEELQLTDVAGDHLLLTGQVTYHKNISDVSILTTDYLKANGFTR